MMEAIEKKLVMITLFGNTYYALGKMILSSLTFIYIYTYGGIFFMDRGGNL